MKKITLRETIDTFNKILEGSKVPQKSLELTPDGRIIAKNRFGKVIDSWYFTDEVDPLVMVRDVCKMLTGEV